MKDASVLLLAIKASIALTVFALGLRATVRDATYLLRHRGLFVRSFLAMNVIMPLLAILATTAVGVHPAVKLAIIALALSPVPPLLPGKVIRSGGTMAYTIGLFVTMASLSIIVIPASVWVLGQWFGVATQMPVSVITRLIAVGILAPLAVGMLVRRYLPRLANRIARPISVLATIVLVGAMIPLFSAAWPDMKSLLGNGTLLVIIGLTFFGIAVGDILGGPVDEDRTVLALATTSRHPSVAIAIATVSFPKEEFVIAAVLLDLIVVAVVTAPYTMRHKRQASDATAKRYTTTPSTARAAGRAARTLHVDRAADRRR